MKVFMRLVLVFITLISGLFLTPVMGQTPGTAMVVYQEPRPVVVVEKVTAPSTKIDRTQMFKDVHEIIPGLLRSFGEYYGGLEVGRLNKFYDSSYRLSLPYSVKLNGQSYPQRFFYDGDKIPLSFENPTGDSDYIFILKDGEPARTAVTWASNANTPIKINLNIINNPKNKFSLLDVVQLMLHENFHYIGDKDQQRVDAQIAKFVRDLQPYYHEIQLPNGERLMILSWPVSHQGGERSQFHQLDTGFFALKETSQGVENWTEKFTDVILQDRLETFKGDRDWAYVSKDIFWQGHTVSFSEDGKNIIIRADIKREDHLIIKDYGPMGYRQDRTSKAQFGLSIELKPNSENNLNIHRLSLEKTYKQVGDLVPRLQILERDGKTIVIGADADTDFDQNKKPRLLVKVGQTEIEVPPEAATWPTKQLKFVLTVPDVSVKPQFEINSLVMNNYTQIFAETALSIPFQAEPIDNARVELGKLKILTPFGWRETSKDPIVEKGAGVIRFTVKSETDLSEVRMRIGINERRLSSQEVSFSDLNTAQLMNQVNQKGQLIQYPRADASYDIRTSFEDVVLNASEFKQKRRGNVVIVEVPVDHVLKERILSPQGKIEQRISRFLKFSAQLYRFIGDDTGERFIRNITFVNTRFAKSTVNTDVKYKIEKGNTEKRRVSPEDTSPSIFPRETVLPPSIKRSCKRVHMADRPQSLTPGKYKSNEEVIHSNISERMKRMGGR